MSKYTVNNIDETKGHVDFTVTFDDTTTYNEVKGDLPLDDQSAFTAALETYVKELTAAHEAEVAEQAKTASFKSKVVGKEVTVADSATVS